MSMNRTATLDPSSTDPYYPSTTWDEDSIAKWLIFVGRINTSEPYKRTDNSDGTITFSQETGPPAMRIYAGASSIK